MGAWREGGADVKQQHAPLRYGSAKSIGRIHRLADWMNLMHDWYAEMRAGKSRRCGRRQFAPPDRHWMIRWFRTAESRTQFTKLNPPSRRTIERDLHELNNPRCGSVAAMLSPQFVYLWEMCYNEYFVRDGGECKPFGAIVKSAFAFRRGPHPDALPETIGGRPVWQDAS